MANAPTPKPNIANAATQPLIDIPTPKCTDVKYTVFPEPPPATSPNRHGEPPANPNGCSRNREYCTEIWQKKAGGFGVVRTALKLTLNMRDDELTLNI